MFALESIMLAIESIMFSIDPLTIFFLFKNFLQLFSVGQLNEVALKMAWLSVLAFVIYTYIKGLHLEISLVVEL